MSLFSSLKQKFNCHIRNKHLILTIRHDWGEEGRCVFCNKLIHKKANYVGSSLNNIRDKTGGEK